MAGTSRRKRQFMCGIVGAVAGRDIVPVLMEGLRRLEYRGYDSAGVAVVNGTGHVSRACAPSARCKMLQEALDESPTARAHRHRAHALGHARRAQRAQRASACLARWPRHRAQRHHREPRGAAHRAAAGTGYQFTSETDTEVIAHRIHYHMRTLGDLFKAVRATVAELEGAYALVVLSETGAGPADPRAHGLPGGGRASARTRISSPRTWPRCCR